SRLAPAARPPARDLGPEGAGAGPLVPPDELAVGRRARDAAWRIGGSGQPAGGQEEARPRPARPGAGRYRRALLRRRAGARRAASDGRAGAVAPQRCTAEARQSPVTGEPPPRGGLAWARQRIRRAAPRSTR